ncbi:MAG TPA: methyltransferase domain-containing protein [Vicinamibacterales bacterium]|nr:methyltransferase domain-containing protein [Vicinamibacterales bacterium]
MWRRLWTAGAGKPAASGSEQHGKDRGSAREKDGPGQAGDSRLDEVRGAFWMMLWRGPSSQDLSEAARALDAGQTPADFVHRFLVSTEFRLLYTAVRDGDDPNRPADVLEEALQRAGDASTFVTRAYSWLLGRGPDREGHDHYVAAIEGGMPRRGVLETFLRSDEFAQRYRTTCPDAGFIPRDVQLCELANPAKWDNPEWVELLTSLGEGPDKGSMHRKAYEFTQLLFGLKRLGALGEETDVLSVGAGHEPVLYWLANHVRRVIATDMYGGVWQSERAMEGDDAVFVDPAQFARFPYRQDRLIFLRMDGRHLAFADNVFDVVYSLSSVEHFGGLEGAKAAVAGMARVLKPGGLLVLSTEYCLGGPPHHEAFQPAQVHALLDHPSLELVEPIDERVWQRYEYVPIDLRVSPYQTPHMVVTDLGSVFTTVMAFLRRRR